MNRRVLLGLILVLALGGSAALGALSNNIITGDAGSESAVKAIQDFISGEVGKLAASDKPLEQQAARDALISAVASSNASPSFLDTYSRLLNDALMPLTKSGNLRVRLNAAIAAARVADKAQNVNLRPAATAFMQDKSEAVIFWGFRAADSIVPAILRNPLISGSDPLLASVVPIAKAHPDGPIAQAAYDTLSLGVISNRPWVATVTPQMLQKTIPLILDLLAFRVERYVHALPADPQSENQATLFLADNRVWAAETDAQRAQGTKLMVNLLSLLCQYTAHSAESGRERLTPVIQQTASALWVVGDFNSSDSFKTAIQPLIKLGINTKPHDLLGMADAVYAAAKSLPGLSDMPKPPTTRPAAAH